MTTEQSSSSTNQTYYPTDIQALINQANSGMGNLGTSYKNINNFLQNPLSGEMFQGTIGPLLQSLQPSEAASRTALADQFRMAGGGQGGALQSGAFAKSAQLNEQSILNNRSQVVAKQASDVFKNILSGLGLQLNAAEAPTQLSTNLIGAIRPVGSGGSHSSGSSQPEQPPPNPQQPGGGGSPSGYGGGGGTPSGYGNPPQSGGGGGGTAPVDFTGLGYNGGGGGYGTQYDPTTGQYISDPGNTSNQSYYDPNNYLTQNNSQVDQYGYTPQDWANDPYYQ